jgi:NAD+ synthase (glutamine-hydrolysing)
MKLIKVAAAALNQTPLAWESNKAHILAAIDAAREAAVSILCLPELCITGYGCEDAFHSPGVQQTARQVLLEIVPGTEGLVVCLGLPLLHRGSLYNTAALVAHGNLLGFVAKQNLAGEGIHYEPRWFKPWPNDARAQVQLDDRANAYPLGDLIFDCGGIQIGFEICEDAWVANRPGSELASAGVDVILNPSASHFAFGKQRVRERFVLEGSRAFGVSYVYANLLGNEAGRVIYDGETMIASGGRMLAVGPRFSFADYQLTTAVIDVDTTRVARSKSSSRPTEPDSDIAGRVHAAFEFPEVRPERTIVAPAPWESGSHVKEEEFTRAVSLGLFDYLRKSRSHGFVVSLSGGADSAATAVLSSLLVRFGANELGRPTFAGKLAHIPGLDSAGDEREMVARLLTCVYQATRNSSATTREAARQVATAVGAHFFVFDVDKIVQDYIQLVSQAIGRELTWDQDDLTLQNIQARARAPSVWMLANLRSALLLSTSNRSEAAVGYATMDGDTCGGLCPIAGIDKAFLRNWLKWMEQRGPDGLGPIPELSAVTSQPPTAELRPHDAGQTDEDDLMPYEVLDAIERSAIRDKQVPVEVYRRMRAELPDYAPAQIAAWVHRFFRLWCRNQWKRERYAPSFHLDDENLDPKTWCRFPILSGGFDRELDELREYVRREEAVSRPAEAAPKGERWV